MLSAVATFVYAGGTACGLGGCAPATVTSTTGTTAALSLPNQYNLTAGALGLTVYCNISGAVNTCFNITNMSLANCTDNTQLYCDGNNKMLEWRNYLFNSSNITNVTKVIVKTGSDPIVVALDSFNGQETITFINPGTGNVQHLQTPDEDIRDVMVTEKTDTTVKLAVAGRDMTGGNAFILDIEIPTDGASPPTSALGADTGIPVNLNTPISIVYGGEGSGDSETRGYGLNIFAATTRGIGVGFKKSPKQIQYGRELTIPAPNTGNVEIVGGSDSGDSVTESGVTEGLADIVVNVEILGGPLIGMKAIGGAILTTGGIWLENTGLTAPNNRATLFHNFPVITGVEATDVAPGFSEEAALLVEAAPGVIHSGAAAIAYQNNAVTLSNALYRTDTLVDGDVAIMVSSIPSDVVTGFEHDGTTHITKYKYAAGPPGKLKLAYDKAWEITGTNGLQALVGPSIEFNPVIYAAELNVSGSGTGTRVVVMMGSNVIGAAEIYNFTADSAAVISADINGGHANDYMQIVLGGRSWDNQSVYLDYFNISLGLDAVNPNGTMRFTTDKTVRIQTFAPDINILNFQLDFQNFNGTFDTTLGTCDNCTFDGANIGWCQAEVEKVWGMFESYNMTINLSTNDAINMTQLQMVCRSFNETVALNSNCSGLSPYGTGSTGCFTPGPATAGISRVSGNSLIIELTVKNWTNSIDIPLGTMQPDATCEQIACEITGTWTVGDPTQNFVINKSITATAN